MSAAKKYLITIDINGVNSSQIWDSESSQRLGYTLPWSLRSGGDGDISLVHDAGNVISISDYLSKKKSLPLPRETSQEDIAAVKLRISEIDHLPPAYDEKMLALVPGRSEWRVYACSGQWIINSKRLEGDFTGERDGELIFELKPDLAGSKNLLSIASDNVLVNEQPSKGVFQVSEADLSNLVIRSENLIWRFQKVSADNPQELPVFTKKDLDPEGKWFRRLALNTGVAGLLLVAIVSYLGKPVPREKTPPIQFAKVVISKPRATPQAVPSPVSRVNEIPEQKKTVQVSKSSDMPAKSKLKMTAKPSSIAKNSSMAKPSAIAKILPPPPLPTARESKNSVALENVKNLQQKFSGLLKNKSNTLIAKSSSEKADSLEITNIVSQSVSLQKNAHASAASDAANTRKDIGFQNGLTKGGISSGEKIGNISVTGSGNSSATSLLSISGASGVIATEEGLSKEEVWNVIKQHLHEIRYCYETAILRNPKLEGKVVVAFAINGRGIVTRPSVKEATMHDSLLNSCVTGRLLLWKFPQPKGKINVDVQYPFIFRRL